MARADSASASAHSDSIKGLAQAVARPAYRRLLTAEPFLRRAVPVLIVAFLVTLGVAAVVDIRERLRQAIFKSADELDLAATVMAERMERLALSESGEPVVRAFRAFERIDWPRATMGGRLVLLTDASNTIISTQPALNGYIGRKLNEAIGRDSTVAPTAILPGVSEIKLADGSAILLARRNLGSPLGQLAITQRRGVVLAEWRADTTLAVTLFSATGFVVLMLGFAFLWQSRLMRETANIEDTVRSRIDTALNCGRCGLWDWDLASGRVFWSQSMFDILGLPPSHKLLSFGEISGLVHPDDVQLYELAGELAELGEFMYRPRVPHAPCERQLGLAAHALRACSQSRRAASPPHRNRSRHHRAEAPRRGERHRRDAVERCDRGDFRSLRRVGYRQPAGAVQFQIPEPAWAERRSRRAGHALRGHLGGRQQADRAHAIVGRGARGPGRPHLRSAARGRALAADQRAPHQGWRLRLGRHEHHRTQAAPGEAARQREATQGDGRGPALLAAGAGAPDRAACLSRRTLRRAEGPRRRGQSGEVGIPCQHEPRAAHAAQRHHRVLRDDGVRDIRPARRRQVSRILPRHQRQRPLPAGCYQRHPRHVENRSRPHQPRIRDDRARLLPSRHHAHGLRRAPTRSGSPSMPRSSLRSGCAPTAA